MCPPKEVFFLVHINSDASLLFPEVMTQGDSCLGKHTHSSHQPEMCRQALDYEEMINQRRQEALQEIFVRVVCVWGCGHVCSPVCVCLFACTLTSFARTVPDEKQPEKQVVCRHCANQVKGYSVRKRTPRLTDHRACHTSNTWKDHFYWKIQLFVTF